MMQILLLTLLQLTYVTAASTNVKNRYIIQLKASATITGAQQIHIDSQQDSLDACLASRNVTYTTDKLFSKVFAGRSITLTDDTEMAALGNCPDVNKVWPIRMIPAPKAIEGGPVRPLEFFTHNMTGVSYAQNSLELTGNGIKVGIIDTGVDYTHPAFGTCTKIGDAGCTFQYGWDFVGNEFNGDNTPSPSSDPLDTCVGHGTHVAGILAGNDINGSVRGVATNVQLGMYRIFGCSGGTTTDLVIAAMRKAVDDGMDIISMSLGGDAGFGDSPEAAVVDELSKQGVIFSVAVGNAGSDGIWMASNPSVAASATAVTSFDSSKGIRRTFTSGGDVREIVFGIYYHSSTSNALAYNLNPSSPPDPATFDVEVVTDLIKSGNGHIASDMCTTPLVNVKGKLVLISRGTCTFYQKSLLLESGGAIGMIAANNRPGDIGPLAPVSRLPIFTISQADGLYLAQKIATKNSMLSFSLVDIVVDLATGGELSTFSTWGLGPDLQIKPDFGAPGGYIYSSYPMKMGGYAVLSGTSMATPYVAGCYALYLEYINSAYGQSMKYKTDSVTIRELFTNYASAIDSDSSQESAIPVPRQGGGLLQLDRVIMGRSRVSPAKLSLGVLSTRSIFTLRITNNDSVQKQYSISLNNAPTVNIYDSGKPVTLNSSSQVYFSSDGQSYATTLVLIVEAGADLEFKCGFDFDTTAALDLTSQFFISGFIDIAPSSMDGATFVPNAFDFIMSVPFAAMQGDLSKQMIVDITPKNSLSMQWTRTDGDQLTLGSSNSIPVSITDYVPNSDWIVFQWRLLVPLQTISIDIYDASKNLLGNVMHAERQSRNGNNAKDTANYMTQIKWNTSYVDTSMNQQYLVAGNYFFMMTYSTVQLIGTSGSVQGSIDFPAASLQFSDAGRAKYITQMTAA